MGVDLSGMYIEDQAPDALAQLQQQQDLQQQVLDWYKSQGLQAFQIQPGALPANLMGPDYGFYNAGNGIGAYVPLSDTRFIAAPHQDKDTLANYISGIGGTTLTHFQDTRNAYKDNPERLATTMLTGGTGFSDTPIGTNITNSLFGTDYKPTVNQTGGPTQQTYDNAAAAGYRTGPTEFGHQLAPAAVGIGAASALSAPVAVGEGSGAAISGAGTAEGVGSATATTAGTGALSGSSTGTAVGNAGNDTLAGGNTVSEDLLYDPSYYDAGNTSYFQNAPADTGGGAFDMGGSQGVFDSSGNPIYQSPGGPSLFDQAKNLASQLGITPASALSYLKQFIARGAPGVVGAIGAARQADALKSLSNQYLDFGAPSRARYEASYLPGFSMSADAGFQDALDQTTKSFLHKASIGGNPAESPNAWQQTMKDVFSTFAYPALQNYRAMNADAGGISRLTSAAPGMATSAIGAQKGIYDALGGAAADIFNPPTDIETAIRTLRTAGVK